MSMLVGTALILFLLIRRQQATVRLGSAVFLVNTVAILVALWITSGYWATTGRAWTPFQANKLGALAVAMLAPELGVGLASIAGFAGISLGKFYFLDPDTQRGFPVGEPWLILIYALFAGVLLAYRLRGLAIERDMLRVQAVWRDDINDVDVSAIREVRHRGVIPNVFLGETIVLRPLRALRGIAGHHATELAVLRHLQRRSELSFAVVAKSDQRDAKFSRPCARLGINPRRDRQRRRPERKLTDEPASGNRTERGARRTG